MNREVSLQLKSVSKPNFFSYLKNLKDRGKDELLYYRRLKELRRIMDHQALNSFFQPIMELQYGETIGFEALNRPAMSKLFPNTGSFYDFIGQSNQVFSFECFCRNLSLQRFIERMPDYDQKYPPLLFLNIHPFVLLDPSYNSGETLQLLSEIGIEPSQVVFELTERASVTDFALFEKVLSHYRSQGYRIAVDDVGSGYSSLKTIIYLKPEFIKLDKSLIQFIDQNKEQQQLVQLLIDFAKKSNTKVIAEGIERLEDLAYIRKVGIDYGQGYALGKPLEKIQKGNRHLFVNEIY